MNLAGMKWRALFLSAAIGVSTAGFAAETPAPAAPSSTPTPAAPATPSPAPIPAPSPGAASSDSGGGEAVELTTKPALYVEAKASREEVYGAIMSNLRKIREEAAKDNLKPQGHAVAVFLTADDDGFTYRAMVPLEAAPDPKLQLPDPIKIGQTPVGKAMKFAHHGEYDDIDSTYDAITAYLDEKGVDAQDVFVEEYLNEPPTSDDPNGEVSIYVLTR